MITKSNRIACDRCRRLIGVKSIQEGKAKHWLVSLDTASSTETFESVCERCLPKEVIEEAAE